MDKLERLLKLRRSLIEDRQPAQVDLQTAGGRRYISRQCKRVVVEMAIEIEKQKRWPV